MSFRKRVLGSALEMGRRVRMKRESMVKEQLAGRGIADAEVLRAMGAVPRHKFVPEAAQHEAYADRPLPIGHDQTISQPYIVAYMSEALDLERGANVLEIGTGSGYQAAVLAEMGAKVFSIEIIPELSRGAESALHALGYHVNSRVGDGHDGWPSGAPFDGVIVTAAPLHIPAPLVEQLREGGRLVVPVGDVEQTLGVYEKRDGVLVTVRQLAVRFVPMTGKTLVPVL